MTKRGRDLLDRALALPMPERAELARSISESLDDAHAGEIDVDPDYLAELLRRAADEPGPGERWQTAEEVVAEIAADLARPKRKPKKRARGA